MRPSTIITRLRAECPVFGGRVAGAQGLRRVVQQEDFPVPHAFVVLLEDPPGETLISQLDQEIETNYAVIVAVSATADDRMQDSAEQFYDIRTELLAALVGWTPDAAKHNALLYSGMSEAPETGNRARSFAQFNFQSQTAISALLTE